MSKRGDDPGIKTLPPSPLMHLTAFPAASSAERRSNRRYPITLRLQYKILRKGRVERLGFGRTVNISTGGVLFEANELVPTTCQIELALHWPFLLQGSCGLKLVMRGRVVRSDDKAIGMEAEFHEFRTAARSLFARSEKHWGETAGTLGDKEKEIRVRMGKFT
jgi:hypothetical protein